MSDTLTIEALSVASFAHQLAELPHELRATITATEQGTPWAVVSISPLTDTRRAVFPLHRNGVMGDTGKRGQSGVMVLHGQVDPLRLVIDRASRMFRA